MGRLLVDDEDGLSPSNPLTAASVKEASPHRGEPGWKERLGIFLACALLGGPSPHLMEF